MTSNLIARYSVCITLLALLGRHSQAADSQSQPVAAPAADTPRMMPAPAIVFAALNVLDLEVTESFYVDMLGMKVVLRIGRPGDERREVTLNFSGDLYSSESSLVLNQDASRTEPYRFDAFSRIAFRVSDLDAIVRRIRDAGYTVLEEPRRIEGTNIRLAFIEDPNGARVELIEGMASAEELESSQ